VNGWTLDKEHRTWGGTVRYATFGEGPPLVLVHGTPFSSYVWHEIAPALAQTRTVYVFDLLGYGSSEQRKDQDVSLAAQSRILAELLDHWQLRKPTIVGHDFGGAIALRTHLLEGRDFGAIALIDAAALSPWGSPFDNLRSETEANTELGQQLADQQQRQAEAGRTLAQGSVSAYMDFVDSAFGLWQGGVRTAERGAKETQKATKDQKG
jgi:pimeloyl-ACP methyl ester carboxylesterase